MCLAIFFYSYNHSFGCLFVVYVYARHQRVCVQDYSTPIFFYRVANRKYLLLCFDHLSIWTLEAWISITEKRKANTSRITHQTSSRETRKQNERKGQPHAHTKQIFEIEYNSVCSFRAKAYTMLVHRLQRRQSEYRNKPNMSHVLCAAVEKRAPKYFTSPKRNQPHKRTNDERTKKNSQNNKKVMKKFTN